MSRSITFAATVDGRTHQVATTYWPGFGSTGATMRNFQGCCQILKNKLGGEITITADCDGTRYATLGALMDTLEPGWRERVALERGGWYDQQAS